MSLRRRAPALALHEAQQRLLDAAAHVAPEEAFERARVIGHLLTDRVDDLVGKRWNCRPQNLRNVSQLCDCDKKSTVAGTHIRQEARAAAA